MACSLVVIEEAMYRTRRGEDEKKKVMSSFSDLE